MNGLTIGADGKTFYTSSLDGAIFAWDLGTARRFGVPFKVLPAIAPFLVDVETTPPLAVSPDGLRFAVRIGATDVGLYSTRTLRRLERFHVKVDDALTAVAWSRSNVLAIVGIGGHVQLWDVSSGPRLVRALTGLRSINGQPEGVEAVAFSPDGRLVAAGDVNHTPGATPYRFGTVIVWDVESGRRVWKWTSRKGWVHELAFSPDGTTLAAAIEDGTVLLFDSSSGRVRRTLHLEANGSFADDRLAYSRDGTLATGTWAGIVQLWDPETGKQIGHPTLVAAAPVSSIAFHPTGEEFATTGGSDGLAKIWETKTQQQFGSTFPGDPGQWGNAVYTPDGSKLIVVYNDGSGFVWPTSLQALEDHACAVAGRNFTREEWSRFVAGRSYTRVCPGFAAGR